MSSDQEEVVWVVDWDEVPAESIPISSVASPASPPPLVPASVPTEPPGEPARRVAPPPSEPLVTPVVPPPSVPKPAPITPKSLVRGQRAKLSDLGLALDFEIILRLSIPKWAIMDVTCLGLDSKGRLSDDRYFVFYNQKETPCGGIALLDPLADTTGALRMQLGKLPATIDRLIVATAFDGDGQMRELGTSVAQWQAKGGSTAEFAFSGADFAGERALMLLEIYRRDGIWRTAALGQGFSGGLAALLGHFGASVT